MLFGVGIASFLNVGNKIRLTREKWGQKPVKPYMFVIIGIVLKIYNKMSTKTFFYQNLNYFLEISSI